MSFTSIEDLYFAADDDDDDGGVCARLLAVPLLESSYMLSICLLVHFHLA